jgi:hypothetical protein
MHPSQYEFLCVPPVACLQNIFVLTNYEEEKASQESEANDDDAMMR